jgi:endonuclease YncB( thermonuclease family)
MRKNQITSAQYKKLFTDISSICERFKRLLVQMYWEIGRRLVEEEQGGHVRAEYGAHVLERLSRDLSDTFGKGYSVKNLERMRNFYVAYPKSSALTKLSWTHYGVLALVEDNRQRKALEKKALRENLTTDELHELVKKENHRPTQKKSSSAHAEKSRVPQLRYRRGAVFTYAIKEITLRGAIKQRVLDCGFAVYNDQLFAAYPALKAGDIVRSRKVKNTFKLETLSAQEAHLKVYTYPARIERVVDGDTVWLYIPCGFGFSVRQKVRLRGIDTPEVATKEGLSAKRFVLSKLTPAVSVVIKSYKPDKYDRYLVDLFYLPAGADSVRVAASGRFLNQELLDAGHAVPLS